MHRGPLLGIGRPSSGRSAHSRGPKPQQWFSRGDSADSADRLGQSALGLVCSDGPTVYCCRTGDGRGASAAVDGPLAAGTPVG